MVTAVAELVAQHPTQRSLIEAYWHRWPEMISGPIDDTVRILAELKHRGVPLFGLTNWSAETFPYARQRFVFLQWFDGIVVSGEEGVMKPNPEIFRRLLDRYVLQAQDALFIDDSLPNVHAAMTLDIEAHHFRSADHCGNTSSKRPTVSDSCAHQLG